MNLYDYRKQIHKIYNDSVYGNTKGDIYSELSEIRLDNDCIKSVSYDQMNKTFTCEMVEGTSINELDNLLSQIREVIKNFIKKNLSCLSTEMEDFLENTYLYFDYYIIKKDENELSSIIIQL
jgi:hypothetical protein